MRKYVTKCKDALCSYPRVFLALMLSWQETNSRMEEEVISTLALSTTPCYLGPALPPLTQKFCNTECVTDLENPFQASWEEIPSWEKLPIVLSVAALPHIPCWSYHLKTNCKHLSTFPTRPWTQGTVAGIKEKLVPDQRTELRRSHSIVWNTHYLDHIPIVVGSLCLLLLPTRTGKGWFHCSSSPPGYKKIKF